MSNLFDLFQKISSPSSELPRGNIQSIIVGLGNPGTEYENTRHNAGFIAVDALAAQAHTEIRNARFHALCAEGVLDQRRVLFLKPQTYMNASGEAVAEALHYYKLSPSQLLVLSDDINLDCGRIRIRASGSDGGQKGLRSIISAIDSDQFPRIRIGVGKKPAEWDLADWVLSRFPKEDRLLIDEAVKRCCQAAPMVLAGEIEKAMGAFNGK